MLCANGLTTWRSTSAVCVIIVVPQLTGGLNWNPLLHMCQTNQPHHLYLHFINQSNKKLFQTPELQVPEHDLNYAVKYDSEPSRRSYGLLRAVCFLIRLWYQLTLRPNRWPQLVLFTLSALMWFSMSHSKFFHSILHRLVTSPHDHNFEQQVPSVQPLHNIMRVRRLHLQPVNLSKLFLV